MPINRQFLLFFFLFYFLHSVAKGAPFHCAQLYSKSLVSQHDMVKVLQSRFGGSSQFWQENTGLLFNKRSSEELSEIQKQIESSSPINPLSRRLNDILSFRLRSISQVLENYGEDKSDLFKEHDWYQWPLSAKRTLLLELSGRWWWEVSSHHTIGTARWFDISYYINRWLLDRQTMGPLSERVHELLGTASQTSFFQLMFENFRTELKVYNQFHSEVGQKQWLQQSLQKRVASLKEIKVKSSLTPLQRYLMEFQLLKAQILYEMLIRDRHLSRAERVEVAQSLNLSPWILERVRLGEWAWSFFPSGENMIGLITITAVNLGLSILIGILVVDEIEGYGIQSWEFNDLLETPNSSFNEPD